MNGRVSEGAGVGVARGGEGPGSIKHQASRTNGSSQEAKRGRTERPSTWVDVEHRDMCEGGKKTNQKRNDSFEKHRLEFRVVGGERLQLDLKGQFN